MLFVSVSVAHSQNLSDMFNWSGCKYFYNGFSSSQHDTNCHNTIYELVFADEFDSTALNLERWQTQYPWGRSLKSKKSDTGWEKQFYTDENVYLSNGYLKLRTVHEPSVRIVPLSQTETAFFGYSSGMIFSKQGFYSGKYEIRCKIPKIEGLFPAFWMYGFCGQEIDVFEFLNETETSNASVDGSFIAMTYHRYYDCQVLDNDKCESPHVFKMPHDMSTDFHVYSVEWNEFKIVWKVDDVIKREVYKYWELTDPPNTTGFTYAFPVKSCKEFQVDKAYTYFDPFPTNDYPVHVIVNTAVLKERAASSGVLPAEFIIDYIKVYKEVPLPERRKKIDPISFYPNPCEGTLYFKMESTDCLMNITDVVGEPIPFQISGNTVSIDAPSGIYFISTLINGELFCQKVIIQID
jgi:hypothetical protein